MGSWVLLTLLFGCVLVNAACQFSCAPHGTCSGNVCVCNTDYTGDDCSIWQTDLALNTPQQNQELKSKHWHYYKLEVGGGGVSGLNVAVAQSSQNGDVDVYIQKNRLPTRSDFMVRDVTGRRHFSLEVNATRFSPGTWYIGCYAFSSVTYGITASPLSLCPNGCSGHGQCSASGSCHCDTGFSGEDCSDGYQPLQIGHDPVTTSLDRLKWAYYSIDVPANQASFTVETTQSSAAEDVDLFIRFNAVPTKSVFDYRDITTNTVSNVTVPAPRTGRYFVGVFSYANTTFTVKVIDLAASGDTCPSACSGPSHGTCSAGVCQCTDCFEGEYCGSSICDWNLDDEPVTGFVAQHAWNFYSFNLESDNTLVVRVTETRVGQHLQDCDLYVRQGQKPSTVHFDYADFGRDSNSTVAIDSPIGLYWVGVYGFHGCTYSAVLEEGNSADCLNDCSGHGTCSGGDCQCEAGFSGVDCSVTEGSLVNGNEVTGNVRVNKWAYYNFTVTAPFVSVQVSETSTSGSVWLFVDLEENPTLANHDYQDVTFDSSFHSVNIQTNSTVPETYYIGVYGDPIMTSSAGVDFTVVAWSPHD